MGRFLFPDDRMAYLIGAEGGGLYSAFNQVLRVYTDGAGSSLAEDLETTESEPITTGELVIDSNSQIPLFYGPDGFTKLFIGSVHGGVIAPIYADISQRLTDIEQGGSLTIADLGQTFTKSVPASVWAITHNLPFRPSVTVVDSAGTEVVGDVAYVDNTTIHITFGGAFSGYAYLS